VPFDIDPEAREVIGFLWFLFHDFLWIALFWLSV